MSRFIPELLINAFSFSYSGSVPSLAAGLFFGSLAGLGAYQLSQNPSNIWLSLSKLFKSIMRRDYTYPKITGCLP